MATILWQSELENDNYVTGNLSQGGVDGSLWISKQKNGGGAAGQIWKKIGSADWVADTLPNSGTFGGGFPIWVESASSIYVSDRYLGTSYLYHSTGGGTWNGITLPTVTSPVGGADYYPTFVQVSAGVLYFGLVGIEAGGWQCDYRVFTSSNGGSSWTQLGSNTANPYTLQSGTTIGNNVGLCHGSAWVIGSDVWIAGHGVANAQLAIYDLAKWNGAAWVGVQIVAGDPEYNGVWGDADHMFLWSAGGKLYHSTNGGSSWTLEISAHATNGATQVRGGLFNGVYTLLCGTLANGLRTSDGAGTWSSVTLPDSDWSSLATGIVLSADILIAHNDTEPSGVLHGSPVALFPPSYDSVSRGGLPWTPDGSTRE